MAKRYKSAFRPMRIQARKGSLAEKRYYLRSGLPGGIWPMPKAIAPGIDPAPLDDLMFHGGKVVPQMEFQNVYLGRKSSWHPSDIASIDLASTLAMRDQHLNNMLVQYFPGAAMSCDPRQSLIMDEPDPKTVDESGVQAIVTRLFDTARISKSDLGTAIFNLILPRGAVLKLDTSSSLHGLGGFHGSLHLKRGGKGVTLYYSANVFSERQPNGTENGIAVFDKSWKNVVATLYHEMNEFRTDADVNDAIQKGDNDFLGWTSRSGQEVGDQPIFVASNLNLVFKEIVATTGGQKLPVQFLYSNAVHGAEGPIDAPHAAVQLMAERQSNRWSAIPRRGTVGRKKYKK